MGGGDVLDLPGRLFRGHIRRRADDLPGLRELRTGLRPAGQTKVADLRDALIPGRAGWSDQQHIGRLEVTMNDSLEVRCVNCTCQDLDETGGLRACPRIANSVRQRAGSRILQADEWQSGMLADLEDLDDMGMLQVRYRLGFRLEARPLGITGVSTRENHLHRHDAIQAYLPGLIDHPHPATSDFLEQFVVGNRR